MSITYYILQYIIIVTIAACYRNRSIPSKIGNFADDLWAINSVRCSARVPIIYITLQFQVYTGYVFEKFIVVSNANDV